MAKLLGTAAAAALAESLLKTMMPELRKELESIRLDIRHIDLKIDTLRQEMYDKFEQQRDTMNQLGERIARLEGRMDVFVGTVHRQDQQMEKWIERVIKVEQAKPVRRRAG